MKRDPTSRLESAAARRRLPAVAATLSAGVRELMDATSRHHDAESTSTRSDAVGKPDALATTKTIS